MDEQHLIAAARYVELNPVRARLCQRPEDWEWSSARAHLAGARPLGGEDFVEALEQRLGRALKRQKPEPKPRQRDTETWDLFDHDA